MHIVYWMFQLTTQRWVCAVRMWRDGLGVWERCRPHPPMSSSTAEVTTDETPTQQNQGAVHTSKGLPHILYQYIASHPKLLHKRNLNFANFGLFYPGTQLTKVEPIQVWLKAILKIPTLKHPSSLKIVLYSWNLSLDRKFHPAQLPLHFNTGQQNSLMRAGGKNSKKISS